MRNNCIILLLIALLLANAGIVEVPGLPSTKPATEAWIVWSLSATPVPTHLQAELRDMGSETLTVGMIEESAEATDPEENAAMQARIQAARTAGLPAFGRSRGAEVVQVVGNISELKELPK